MEVLIFQDQEIAVHATLADGRQVARTITPQGTLQATITSTDGNSLTVTLPAVQQVYTITNQKGGVGKTPTSVSLAFALVRIIKAIFGISIMVLLVDMDPQASLSEYFLAEQADTQEETIFDALCGGPIEGPWGKPKPIAPIIINEHLHLLSAHDGLAGAEIILPKLSNIEARLKKVLSFYAKTYLFAVVDCPPNLGLLNKNALAAATKVGIPVKTEKAAERTLKLIHRSIDDVIGSDLNGELTIWGILPTLYDARSNHHKDILVQIYDKYPGMVYPEVSAQTTLYNKALDAMVDVGSINPELREYWNRLAISMLSKGKDQEGNDEKWSRTELPQWIQDRLTQKAAQIVSAKQ